MHECNTKREYIITADIDGKHRRKIFKSGSEEYKAIRDKGGVKMSAIIIKELIHRYFVEK